MKILLSEVRVLVREELYRMLDEMVSKDLPNGTAWKLAGKVGWGAKNHNGVTNYWYGKDEVQNKENANKFRNDSTKKPKEPKSTNESRKKLSELSPKTLGSYVKKASRNVGSLAVTAGIEGPWGRSKAPKKALKRLSHIGKATDKLTNWTTKAGNKATRDSDGSISYKEK